MLKKVHQAFNTRASKSGFTIVELSLTMAFVAVLLITIAIVTTNIVTIYQKGLTIKAVNSVGRGLTDEFITGINAGPAVDTTSLCNSYAPGDRNACFAQHGYKYIFQEKRDGEKQLNGIFCTGNYSYLWNTHYGYQTGRTITAKYRYGGSPSDTQSIRDKSDNNKAPRLVRIKDPTYRLCTATMNTSYQIDKYPDVNGIGEIDITNMFGVSSTVQNIINETPEQGMLNAFDLDLELYELKVFPISQDTMTLRTFMSGTFTLATTRGNIDITRSGDYCQPNRIVDLNGNLIEGDTGSLSNLGSEFNYCAINKFNFAARTAGVD